MTSSSVNTSGNARSRLSLMKGVLTALKSLRTHSGDAVSSTLKAVAQDGIFTFFLVGSFSAFGIMAAREYLGLKNKSKTCSSSFKQKEQLEDTSSDSLSLSLSTTSSTSDSSSSSPKNTPKKSRKPKVDKLFWTQLHHLLSISFPSPLSSSSLLLLAQFFLLVMRTELTIKTTRLSIYYLTRAISKASWRYWTRWFTTFSGWMLCGVFVNSGLKYIQSLLQLDIRQRLTLHAHSLYLGQGVSPFYRTAVLDPRTRAIDQRIATDIEAWSDHVAFLYGHSFKPTLEFMLSLREASRELGVKRPLALFSLQLCVDRLLRVLSPSLGPMVAQQAELEGGFRSAHSRLVSYAEEVSFLRGHQAEKRLLDERLCNLISVRRMNELRRIGQSVAHQVGKFQGMLVGGLFVHIPFLMEPYKDETEQIARFRATEALMLRCGQSFVEVLHLHHQLQRLSGYTHRIHEFMGVLNDVSGGSIDQIEHLTAQSDLLGNCDNTENTENVLFTHLTVSPPTGAQEDLDRLLVKDLTLQVCKGKNILVTGPNGCGKSSLFRVLAGLWPAKQGSVAVSENHIMWLPQKSYLVMGSLRDQVSYPEKLFDTSRDSHILDCLADAGLSRLAQYSGDLDRVYVEWDNVLSGGERQRLGFARLFFRSPRFAVLDEATSAINAEEEHSIYAKVVGEDYGITVMSIAHRMELRRYHDYELRIKGDGHGGWELCPLVKSKGKGKGSAVIEEIE